MLLQRILWLPAWLLLAANASAQQGVHRCVGTDGNPVFTDQPCAALQATPAAASSSAQTAPSATGSVSETRAAVLCAANLNELRQSVVEAFASRDPNRLAGLMLWGGQGRNAVVADIHSLNALMQRPLLSVDGGSTDAAPTAPRTDDIYDPTRSPNTENAGPAKPVAPAPDHQIVVHTAPNDGSGTPQETRFNVVRRSGCLWLRPSG